VPGFGSSVDAGAIGESFGDYFAVTVGLDAAKDHGWPVLAPEACVMDWDATSYTDTEPHCLRRLDTNLTVADRTFRVHFDGQIWSRALRDIRAGYVALGKTTEDWDRTLIEASSTTPRTPHGPMRPGPRTRRRCPMTARQPRRWSRMPSPHAASPSHQ
jgi:hypothetical protein